MKNASRRRRLLAAATTTAIVSGGAVALAAPANAQQATGGDGRYLQQIQWMDFGQPDEVIPAGGTTKTEHIDLGGQDVALTCEIGPQTGGTLATYRSGSWRGDALDDLYNVGGTGTANELTNALVTAGDHETTQFDFSCSATLNGAPLDLGGLVFADAEQSDSVEWIAATAPAGATWRIIDRYRTPGCASTNTATVDAQDRLRIDGSTPTCDSGPSAVAFLDGATSASNVTLHGGGRSAIALGVVLTTSTSDDAPSYGGALHLQQPRWKGGNAITASGTAISDDAFELATLEEPTPRLGARADRSDGFTLPGSITTWPGQRITVPVACSGDGDTVAAWADLDQNGVFDADERATATCTDDTAALSWTVPDDVASGDLHIRARIATDATELADPTGVAADGEVESHTVSVVRPAPTAEADTATTEQNTTVDADVLANDTPSEVSDAAFDTATLHLVDGDGKRVDTLAVTGGTAEVRDGTVRFTPTPGYSGPVDPITYTVQDSTGQWATSTLTVAVTAVTPTAADDTVAVRQGGSVSADVLANDEAGNSETPLDPSTLELLDGTTPVDELTVADQGTFRVQGGRIKFEAARGFTGTTKPVEYSVADVDGTRATARLTVTVDAVTPVATDDTATVRQGGTVTNDVLKNDVPGDPDVLLDPSTLTVADGEQDGVGSFAVVDDQIRFTGAPTFTGTATATYTVRDENGTPATGKLTVTVEAVTPTAADDTASVRQGGTVTTDVLENDAAGDPDVPLDPSSVTVADGEQDGVGTFDVVDGRIRFVGERAFTGTAMVHYTVRDANGTPVSAVLAVDVIAVTPTAMPDAVATEQSDAVRVPVLDNDAAGDPDVPLDPATLAFVQDGTPTDTVTEPGVGSWKTEDGGIVFVPEPGFSSVATTGYRVADTNGTLAESTVTVTVTAVVPVATADEATTDQGVARTVDVLDNDRAGRAATPLDPETLALVAPTAAAGTARVVGDDVPELRVDGQGTWTVTDDHRIRFAPAVSFTGTAHATYAVQDANGTRVTAAVTVDVRPAVLDLHRDEVRGTQGDRLTVRPLENDRAPRGGELDPETLRLSAPDDVRGAIVAADGHSVTVPGEGRWTVDTASAEVTFQPEPDFIGEAHPIPYTIANVHGVTGSSQITATLDAAPAELAFTGATLPLGALLAAALMTGLGVLLHRRRRA